jgi:hypothetical protein
MATTTNYGWTTPDDTALVKDGAAAIRTLGSSVDTTTKALNPSTTLGDIEYRSSTANTNTRLPIGTNGQVLGVSGGVPAWVTNASGMTNPMTTTGDTIYSSSGSTPARLGIGTTGQVLTVAGGVPSWATASAGGMTSIASGNLTGATVSLTSIAGTYKNLILVIRDYYFAGAFNFRSQLNSNSGSVYWNAFRTNDHTNATVVDSAGFQTSLLRLSGSSIVNNADNNNVTVMQINDYANATSNKLIQVQSAFIDNGTNRINVTNNAVFNDTTAITSIQIYSDGSTFSGGTYVLYGVS